MTSYKIRFPMSRFTTLHLELIIVAFPVNRTIFTTIEVAFSNCPMEVTLRVIMVPSQSLHLKVTTEKISIFHLLPNPTHTPPKYLTSANETTKTPLVFKLRFPTDGRSRNCLADNHLAQCYH